jgi:hypothetical protein
MRKLKFLDYLSVSIFVVVMYFIPWENLQGFPFVDREQYIKYFIYQENVLTYKKVVRFSDYITNEVLWHALVPYITGGKRAKLEYFFYVISTFCLTIFAFFLVKHGKPYSLFLLVNPLMVDFTFSQLRMALSYSLLVIAYMSRIRYVILIAVFSSLLIHTSTVIFLFIYLFIKILERINRNNNFNRWIVLGGCVLLGFSISIATGPLRKNILLIVQDRRIKYDDLSSSITYASFWIVMLILCIFQRNVFFKSETNRYSIIILSLVTFNLFTSGYSLRFLSAALPMLVSTMLSMDRKKRSLCVVMYMLYMAAQWGYWVST